MDTSCTLHYTKPACEWFEAMALGCGSRGAMVLGKCDSEDILLNQDTLWAGLPGHNDFSDNKKFIGVARELIDAGKYAEATEFVKKYMVGERLSGYLPLGHIKINFAHTDVSDYVRALDLSSAVYSCDYTSGSVKYHREGFLSHPHKAFVQKFTAENGKLSFDVTMDSEIKAETVVHDGYIKLIGRAPISNVDTNDAPIIYDNSPDADCVKFRAWLWVETDGEKLCGEKKITVKNASYAVLYQVCDTSFIDWKSMPRKDADASCERLMLRVLSDGYDKAKELHTSDYSALFSRTKLTLEKGVNSALPTDERLKKFADDMSDNELCALYYNFGRYLTICAQREDSRPGNLQGIWSWKSKAEWGSDMHLNINLQMNYWCAENANLSECRMSLFKWLKELHESGKKTAHDLNACRGSCAYHITDLWAKTTPTAGAPQYAYWPMGEAWLAMDIFDHYEYTKDINFLAEYFDILKDNALFLYDWLYFDGESGYYVTSPSTTPENRFCYIDENGEKKQSDVSKATTCDMSIIREVFCDFIKASEILGRDEDFAASVAEKLELLFPYQIGEKGDLLEWFKDFEQTELGHRHMSHMLSVYPGSFINEYDTPELFRAVEKSLEIRLDNGSGYTGWSCAWALIFLAKFRNTTRICEYIKRLLRDSTSPNLFDLHPPHIFQIDGNDNGRGQYGHWRGDARRQHIGVCSENAKEPRACYMGQPDAEHVHGKLLSGVWKRRVGLEFRRGAGLDCNSVDEREAGFAQPAAYPCGNTGPCFCRAQFVPVFHDPAGLFPGRIALGLRV